MKKLSVVLLIQLVFSQLVFCQTGIGTSTPHASAKLDVSSTDKGFLPPRVTLTSASDASTITSPATGLLVYNTGNNPNLVAGYYYWNGANWATIATATGSGVYASYMRGSRSAAQTTGITTNGLIAFTQTDNVAGQDISLNTSTGQITLAAGKTYRLLAQVPNYQTSSNDARTQFAWYNETTSSYVGSSSASYSAASSASWGATGGLSEAIITANINTTVSFRIVQASNINQIGGSGDFNTAGSYPWFDIQVISGNQAIEPDRVGKFVDAGVTVSLDNLKVAVIAGTGGLAVGTVSGTMNLYYQGAYTNQAGTVGTNFTNATGNFTTTLSSSLFGWGFTSAGNTVIYHLTDLANLRAYRVTMIIMPSFLKNFISIERLNN